MINNNYSTFMHSILLLLLLVVVVVVVVVAVVVVHPKQTHLAEKIDCLLLYDLLHNLYSYFSFVTKCLHILTK
jgi:hypothetical protein